MAVDKNLNQFTDDFREIERVIGLGYCDPSAMLKVEKFSRSNLANNTVSLLGDFNNLNPFLDIDTPLYIASTNNTDTVEIKIEIVNQLRDLETITVTLIGTTPVSLGSNIYCIWRMYNNDSSDLVGIVNVTSNATGVPADDSEVFCRLSLINGIANNQSLTPIFSIPRNYSGFIIEANIQTDKGADVKGAMFIRPFDNVFRFLKALASFQNQNSYQDMFLRVSEKTDIKPLGLAQTGGIVFVEYTIIIIHNDYLDKHIRK
jgi:hypothetical protein